MKNILALLSFIGLTLEEYDVYHILILDLKII